MNRHHTWSSIAHKIFLMSSLATVLAGSVSACGTGGGGGAGEPIAAQALCERLAREVCAVEQRCCRPEPAAVVDVFELDASGGAAEGGTDGATRLDVVADTGRRADGSTDGSGAEASVSFDASTTEGSCEAVQLAACEQTVGVMIRDVRLGYLPARAGALIAAVQAAGASCGALPGAREVRAMFVGTAAERANCSPPNNALASLAIAQASCANQTTCRLSLRADGVSAGVCERRMGDDSACSHPFDCPLEQNCALGADWQPSQWGRCESPRTNGAPCREDVQCASNYCSPGNVCATRTPAAFCLAQTYPQRVLLERPEMYLRLGDVLRTSANDSSGSSNNGAYQGATSRESEGALQSSDDGAVRLDGMSGWLSAAAPLQRTQNAGFTLELWVRARDVVGRRPIVELFDVNDGTGFNIWTEGTTLVSDFVGLDGSSHRVVAGNQAVAAGRWAHVVATYDGAVGRLYIDGQMSGQIAASSLRVRGELRLGYRAATAPVMMGMMVTPGTPASYFSGELDEVAIYGRALPAVIVRQHVLAGANGQSTMTSPVFRWLE